MTRAQIARALREAAMYTSYRDGVHCPYCAVFETVSESEKWCGPIGAINALYPDDHFLNSAHWPTDITILALLFASEAVEGEE